VQHARYLYKERHREVNICRYVCVCMYVYIDEDIYVCIQRETERSDYMYVCVRRARAHTHTLSGQMDCDETMQWSKPAATNPRARECAGITCIEAEKLVFLQRSRSSSGSLDRDAGVRCLGK
jgi:hypothetical protein